MDLNTIWFFLLGLLLIGYAILDGFDLGVGALHLFSKGDTERRTLLNSIGPVWDGNEVWLVTAGGALFAAFPHAYATAFSGYYLAFMLLLFALIFRAVAIEFRSKEQMGWWRKAWDIAFSVASIVASILFGVAVGNLIVGLPIDGQMIYRGSFFDLLSPYALLVGVFNLSMFMMHGSIYLYLKTEGDLQAKAKRWIYKTFSAFVILYVFTTIFTLRAYPSMITNFEHFWWAWIVAALNALAIANIPRALHLGLPFRAFLSSCCTIAALVFLFGIGVFPNMIISSESAANNLTIYNAASSQETLKIMLIMAIMGLPFVAAYTTAIYWVFRGKVKIDRFSY
ncbi:cytochrome d ubiquinol oxidase subunit II [Candidatus Sumerlaeota bacterium]|nr:cytochrome d ubiquinol oxidase subunit II [Candidatus Sumerlaeota bacterium]